MPQFTHFINVPIHETPDLHAICYGTFLKLGWIPKFAGEKRIIGFTHKSWETRGEEIIAEINEGILEVTSKMIRDQSFDLTNKNKKNVTAFLTAFEEVRTSTDETTRQEWNHAVEQMKQETLIVAEQERKEQEEVESVMHLSKGSKTITHSIIVINVVVFLAMVISGAGFFEPSTTSLIRWGANFKPYTLDGQWWRLITNIFVHIGIIHILFNMYALYMIGIYLEPMLGRVRYTVAYLCTGIYASLTSLWWHSEDLVSAGASGAIFGLYGIFLALLTTNLIPKKNKKGSIAKHRSVYSI